MSDFIKKQKEEVSRYVQRGFLTKGQGKVIKKALEEGFRLDWGPYEKTPADSREQKTVGVNLQVVYNLRLND